MDAACAVGLAPCFCQGTGKIEEVKNQAGDNNAMDAMDAMHTPSTSPLGIAEHAGHRFLVMFPSETLTRHLLIAGKSGEGKSTCLEYLACRAMEQGASW